MLTRRHLGAAAQLLASLGVRTYEASQPLPGHVGKRFGAYETIAVVRHGAEVTIRLPRSEWATVGLLYDPSKFRDDGAYLIKDMAQVARLEACKSASFNHGVSQFDGGSSSLVRNAFISPSLLADAPTPVSSPQPRLAKAGGQSPQPPEPRSVQTSSLHLGAKIGHAGGA